MESEGVEGGQRNSPLPVVIKSVLAIPTTTATVPLGADTTFIPKTNNKNTNNKNSRDDVIAVDNQAMVVGAAIARGVAIVMVGLPEPKVVENYPGA